MKKQVDQYWPPYFNLLTLLSSYLQYCQSVECTLAIVITEYVVWSLLLIFDHLEGMTV